MLPVTVGASLSFPEVMAGGGVPGAALGLLVEPPPDREMNTTHPVNESFYSVRAAHWWIDIRAGGKKVLD